MASDEQARLLTLLGALRERGLAHLAPRVPFVKGAVFGRQGEPCTSLFVIASGRVLLRLRTPRGEEGAVYLLGPGDLFGEGSMLPNGIWLYTAEAVTPGVAHSIAVADVVPFAGSCPEFAAHLLRRMAARLHQANRRGGLITVQGARERVLGFLAVIAESQGERHGDEVWVSLTVTQGQLGEMLGLARETVSRVISELSAEGLIRHVSRRGFWIRGAALTCVLLLLRDAPALLSALARPG